MRSFGSEAARLRRLVARVYPQLEKYVAGSEVKGAKVLEEFLTPRELRKRVDFELPRGEVEAGKAEDVLEQVVRDALQYGVRTSHPLFMDKLYSGSDAAGQVVEWAIATMNTNVHTFAVSPVFAVAEQVVVARLCELVGWEAEASDGLTVPGGSMANLTSMVVARNLRSGGRGRPVVLATKQAHYSVSRNAMVTGVGVRWVDADRCGRMVPESLEEQLGLVKEEEEGEVVPFYVHATSGTTVTGAFDPLARLADVVERAGKGVWLHVDAAWGGGVLFSRDGRRRALMEGVERADSVAFNPHKMLGVPLQCSALLMQRRGELEKSNSSKADYLFHEEADGLDLGDKSLQCGRKADGWKLFALWKFHGEAGFGRRVDRGFELARELAEEVRARKDRFVLVMEPESLNVCFWFVPESVRAEVRGRNAWPVGVGAVLDGVTRELYARMQREGTILINFNPIEELGLPRFLRAVVHEGVGKVEGGLGAVLDEIERLGEGL